MLDQKKTVNGYWLKFHWVEDDRNEIIITTPLEQPAFEALLVVGMKEVNTYPTIECVVVNRDDKRFAVRCLPEAWEQLIYYLEDHGCQSVRVVYHHYEVDDMYGDVGELFVVKRIEKQPPIRSILGGK